MILCRRRAVAGTWLSRMDSGRCVTRFHVRRIISAWQNSQANKFKSSLGPIVAENPGGFATAKPDFEGSGCWEGVRVGSGVSEVQGSLCDHLRCMF
jgi:hypothetical protein